MNQELYSKLLDSASVIVAIQKFEETIETKKAVLEDCNTELEEGAKKIKEAEKSYGKQIGWGKFLTIFGLVNDILLIFSIIITSLQFEPEEVMNELPSMIVSVLLLVGLGLLGILLLNGGRTKRKKLIEQASKEYKTVQEVSQIKINTLNHEIEQLDGRMKNYIAENHHRLSFLPSDYQNPHAIGFMLKAFENMRADNLKELINLYEQELHFLQQQHFLNNAAKMQKIHNENVMYVMESINRNQDEIKSNLQLMQAMQIINMLDDNR